MSIQLEDRAERFLINEIKAQSTAAFPDETCGTAAIAVLQALDLITEHQAKLFAEHLHTAVINRREELRKERQAQMVAAWEGRYAA